MVTVSNIQPYCEAIFAFFGPDYFDRPPSKVEMIVSAA